MATVTITPVNTTRAKSRLPRTTTLSTEVVNGGLSNQLTNNFLAGSVGINRPSVVATIKLVADTGKKFLKVPTITAVNREDSQHVNLFLTGVEKTSNFITTYNFNVVYNNDSEVVNPLNYKLDYKEVSLVTRSLAINNLKYTGEDKVRQYGDRKIITVSGSPNTPFVLTVNKIIDSRETLADGTVRVVNSVEESILSTLNKNSTKVDSKGNTVNCISRNLDSTGKFTFNQDFPGLITVISTKVNGSMAASGATKIIFDSLTGVEVGDKIESSNINSNKTVTVITLNPDSDNVNECTLSESVTLADNADVIFRRGCSYGLDITSDHLNSRIPTTTPTFTLNQYINPTLTLTATENGSRYTITDQNSVTTSAGTVSTASYVGIADSSKKSPSNNNKWNISYLLTGSGGTAFSTVAESPSTLETIRFSTSNSSNSSWTNSLPSENGGTDISITNIATTAAGAQTITITATVIVHKWGTQNVTMDFDLSKVVVNA